MDRNRTVDCVLCLVQLKVKHNRNDSRGRKVVRVGSIKKGGTKESVTNQVVLFRFVFMPNATLK